MPPPDSIILKNTDRNDIDYKDTPVIKRMRAEISAQ